MMVFCFHLRDSRSFRNVVWGKNVASGDRYLRCNQRDDFYPKSPQYNRREFKRIGISRSTIGAVWM